MMNSDYGYGTREYVCDILDSDFDKIKLIKLITGETLIGLVYEGVFSGVTIVDFPLEIKSDVYGEWYYSKYTPYLEYESIEFKNEHVMFVKELEESTNFRYSDILKKLYPASEDGSSFVVEGNDTLN